MESPFGQAMGWLAKAQKNPEFEAHLPFLVGLKGELEWKRGMTHVMLFFGRGCHVLKACLKSFSICPIVKDPTDLLNAFIATAVPRLTNPEALSESPLNVWVLNGVVIHRGDRMTVTERC